MRVKERITLKRIPKEDKIMDNEFKKLLSETMDEMLDELV